MREIVLDTETTGLDPDNGDRVVEIGAVEVLNAIPTGNAFHAYLNPDRAMPEDAFRVHGLSGAFLADKRRFSDLAAEFTTFIGADRIVAHNAQFDVSFLNAEFARCGHPPIEPHRVVDTLALARRKHAGASNSLDALCARYGVDAGRRTKHGALLDAELLAEVYLELRGGRQATLVLSVEGEKRDTGGSTRPTVRPRPSPLRRRITEEERAAHTTFIATFEAAIWDVLWPGYSAGEKPPTREHDAAA